MPYKSKAQLGFMHARHPEVAKRWDKKYGVPKDMPEHVEDTPRTKKKSRVKGGSCHGKR